MNDDKRPTPGEASREGLRELDEQGHHHETTAHTPPVHPHGAEFDETAGEIHRGGPLPYEKK